MSNAENLAQLLQKQREVMKEFEAEVKAIAESDLTVENAKLKQEVERLAEEHRSTKEKLNQVLEDNHALKSAFVRADLQ